MGSNLKKVSNRILIVALMVLALMVMQGCVVFLTSVATVVKMRGDKHSTTTVLVKKDPSAVYTAMKRILERKTDVEVLKIQEEDLLIEVSRGEAHASAKAVDYGSGLTQLIVTADTGKGDRSDEDLALDVVKQICDELGVEYKVL